MLAGAFPPRTVQWGYKLKVAAPIGDGRYELTFADGSTVTTELIVASHTNIANNSLASGISALLWDCARRRTA